MSGGKKTSPGNSSKRLSYRFDDPDSEPLLATATPSLSAVLSTEGVGTLLFALVCPTSRFTAALTLAALSFIGGRVSSSHLNPAVTIAYVVRGYSTSLWKGMEWRRGAQYVLAQLLGATMGCLLRCAFFGAPSASSLALSGSAGALSYAMGLLLPCCLLALTHVAGKPRCLFAERALRRHFQRADCTLLCLPIAPLVCPARPPPLPTC